MTEEQIDPLAILRELGVDHVDRVDPITDGWGGTRLWRVTHDDIVSLLRLYPKHQRDDRDRELAILEEVEHVPIPRVEAWGDPSSVPSLVLSWCPGETLLTALRQNHGRAWALGVAFGRIQAELHNNPVTERLRTTLNRDWITWGTFTENALATTLRERTRGRESLIHLDYHPLNALVIDDRISCVIDWTNGHIGDPRADLARTYSILSWMPFPAEVDLLTEWSVRRVFRRGWIHGYQDAAGPVDEMAPFLAWAAATMRNDLGSKVGQPGFWVTVSDLERLRRRELSWLRRTGIGG